MQRVEIMSNCPCYFCISLVLSLYKIWGKQQTHKTDHGQIRHENRDFFSGLNDLCVRQLSYNDCVSISLLSGAFQIHWFAKEIMKNDLTIRTKIEFGMCNILAGSNCHDSNRCNHDFSIPLKTFDVQNESELEPLYDRHVCFDGNFISLYGQSVTIFICMLHSLDLSSMNCSL